MDLSEPSSSMEDQMGNEESTSSQEWSVLFDAAIAFKGLKCWEWMYDSDVFGVQNPETGEIGYCCVMGRLGEVLALNVYPGPKGLASYRHLHELARRGAPEDALGSHALLNTQRCVMVSYEDRSDLQAEDLDLIRSLGLKFRGKKAWPMFRSYRPGYLPWFLSSSEARLLLVALQQAVKVAEQIRVDPLVLGTQKDAHKKILVRKFEKGMWKDAWEHPPEDESLPIVPIINDLRLAQLKQANFPRKGTWATDCIFLPMPIQDGTRPYFPYAFPVLSREGMIMGMELLNPGEIESTVPQTFMDLLEKAQSLPQSLQVGSEQIFVLLEPIARKLKFPIQRVEPLPALEAFLQSMEGFLGGAGTMR